MEAILKELQNQVQSMRAEIKELKEGHEEPLKTYSCRRKQEVLETVEEEPPIQEKEPEQEEEKFPQEVPEENPPQQEELYESDDSEDSDEDRDPKHKRSRQV